MRGQPTRDYANVLDQSGNVIGRIDKQGTVYGLGGMGEFVPWGSIGGDIWELFNPGQVQAEYEAVGKVAPTREEIMSGAAQDAVERAQENIAEGMQATVAGATQMGKWVVIGLVAYAIIQAMQALPKGK